MAKFIGMTVGLECNNTITGKVAQLVKVEYHEHADGTITLRPVSGRNLSNVGGMVTITRDEFDARPTAHNTDEAIWALSKCHWVPMALDDGT